MEYTFNRTTQHNGALLIATIKQNVRGFKKQNISDATIFKRGRIVYTIKQNVDIYSISKFDYTRARYLFVAGGEFREFFDLITL